MKEAVEFHTEAFTRLATQHFGSVESLRQAWTDSTDARADDDLAETTLRAWLKGRLPNRGHLFRLGDLLDVDPLVLIDVDKSALVWIMNSLRERFFQQPTELSKRLSYLFDLLQPSSRWPNPHAVAGSGRPVHNRWVHRDVLHGATDAINYYPRFDLKGDRETQVWYFAYCDVLVQGLVWRPYGAVRRIFETVELYSEAGVYEDLTIDPESAVPVRTFFGAGAAEFRVASLHDFSLRLQDRPTSASGSVTFP